MISSMINNREFVETQHYFSSEINSKLISATEKYYGIPLNASEKLALTSMELSDKQWLLQEYEKEVTYSPADLDNIY